MKTLLLLLSLLLALPAVLHAQAPAGMSKVEADAYNAAYAAEMARIHAQQAAAQPYDPLAAPKKPDADAGKDEWIAYENAVAAWNQRCTAAQQQAAVRQQQAVYDRQAAVAARMRENKAEAKAKEQAESEAAYQRWLQMRQIQAMEAIAQAQQLELLRKQGKLPK